MLAGVNILAAGIGVFGHILGWQPSRQLAAILAAALFVGLTALNTASACRHAREGRRILWPLLVFFEVLAVGASWSAWSLAP